MILLIDNYDSFVFNLERYLQRLGQETLVVRNNAVPLGEIASGTFSAVVISPGPRSPAQAGQSLEVIERFHQSMPILGVCLGHQAICQAFGADIVRAGQAIHGRCSPITYTASALFEGLPNPFSAARYHSLIADPARLSDRLRVTATCPADPVNPRLAGVGKESLAWRSELAPPIVMAVEHRDCPLFGVQFHPESILSEVGYRILANFLRRAGLAVPAPLPRSDFSSPSVWSEFEKAGQRESEVIAPPVVLPGRGLSGG